MNIFSLIYGGTIFCGIGSGGIPGINLFPISNLG
jgi:hypothetical protein